MCVAGVALLLMITLGLFSFWLGHGNGRKQR